MEAWHEEGLCGPGLARGAEVPTVQARAWGEQGEPWTQTSRDPTAAIPAAHRVGERPRRVWQVGEKSQHQALSQAAAGGLQSNRCVTDQRGLDF